MYSKAACTSFSTNQGLSVCPTLLFTGSLSSLLIVGFIIFPQNTTVNERRKSLVIIKKYTNKIKMICRFTQKKKLRTGNKCRCMRLYTEKWRIIRNRSSGKNVSPAPYQYDAGDICILLSDAAEAPSRICL